MTARRRRVRVTLSIVALAALGTALPAYYVLVRSPGVAIEHAESFLFRRMHVVRLAEQGAFRFFYVTNRGASGQGSPLERFGVERADALTFGLFDAAIEPSVGLGMLLNPTEWFQNEEISLRDVRELERAAFVEQLRGYVADAPYKSLLIVVHGFREAFPSALRKTAFVGHVLDIDSPVLLFDWPGNQGSSLAGYRRAHAIAKESGADLAETLEMVVREIRPERLWLMANSMGGEVVANALRTLYQNSDWADTETEIEQLVLTAPDVGRDEFDEEFKPMITALARNLTVYVSSNDRALLMSRLVNRGRRLGESTLSPDQLEEAIELSRLLDSSGEVVSLVDVTPVNRTRNFHNFSLETPEFFDDLYLRLTDAERSPRTRLLYPSKTPEGNLGADPRSLVKRKGRTHRPSGTRRKGRAR